MVVAFDCDGVFDDARIQLLAKKMKCEGNEIWIVTARKENQFNKDIVLLLASKIGLSEYSIIYATYHTDEQLSVKAISEQHFYSASQLVLKVPVISV